MRKPYIAPSCEYMTFTVDSAIASAPCSQKGTDVGATYANPDTCQINANGLNLFSEEASCTITDIQGYCYYSSSISIFGS